jgi:uncharacterized protein
MRFWVIFNSILVGLIFYTAFKISQLIMANYVSCLLITLVLFFIMLGWNFIYQAQGALVTNKWFRIFVWISAIFMGLWATFIVLGIFVDLINILLYFCVKLEILQITLIYKDWFYQYQVLLILLISIITCSIGFKDALLSPEVKEVVIPVVNLPKVLQELVIVQISDLHVGPFISNKHVTKVAQIVKSLHPDLLVLTGDIADGIPAFLVRDLQPLASLSATLGKYYVTGNHEYYWGVDRWISQVKELGFTPLINQNCVLNFKGASILIAGVPDISASPFKLEHKQDFAKAIFTHEICSLKILLAHNPNIYKQAEQIGFDILLAAHTHGGQFFPCNLLLPLFHRYYHGLNRIKNMWLYVNSGAGLWGAINRFGVHAEITLIKLRKQ